MAAGLKARKRNKFNAVKTEVDGYRFDSKIEAKRYAELKLLASAKEIFMLKVHPSWSIDINGYHVCTVIADFSYYEKDNTFVIEDVKGHDTAMSRLKRKLVMAVHHHDIKVVT